MKGYGKSAHHVSAHGPMGVHPKGGPQPPFVWSVSRRGDFQGEREIEIPLPLNGIFPPFLPWKKAVAPQSETSRQGQSPCPTGPFYPLCVGRDDRRAARMSLHPYGVQTNKTIPRCVHTGGCFCVYSSSFLVEAMHSSSSCFCSTKLGAPIMTSWAFLFMGKGMISRMESSPASSMTMRSTPGAMPA